MHAEEENNPRTYLIGYDMGSVHEVEYILGCFLDPMFIIEPAFSGPSCV